MSVRLNLQNRVLVRQSSSLIPSPPLSPKAEGESAGGAGGGAGAEDAGETGPNEPQEQAMQQEERILTEQIESLQKEKCDIKLDKRHHMSHF